MNTPANIEAARCHRIAQMLGRWLNTYIFMSTRLRSLSPAHPRNDAFWKRRMQRLARARLHFLARAYRTEQQA